MAGFSGRAGGVSGAYGVGELNLGWTPEDEAALVAENRQRFVGAVAGASQAELVTVRQAHGDVVRVVARGMGPLATAEGKAALEGDGLMTREVGVLLGVQTADCVPVLVADTRTRAVAAFHAGWRGTVARIVEKGVAQMTREFGTRPEDLIVAVGPCIRVCCFEVGDEVRERFAAEFAYAKELFVGKNVDLQEANRRQLVEAGVAVESISVVAECSACARDESGRRKYFSHRAEMGMTGRMLSVIGVRAG
jgi:YfiH family protein